MSRIILRSSFDTVIVQVLNYISEGNSIVCFGPQTDRLIETDVNLIALSHALFVGGSDITRVDIAHYSRKLTLDRSRIVFGLYFSRFRVSAHRCCCCVLFPEIIPLYVLIITLERGSEPERYT